jgi:hypothetical protein
VNYYYLLFNVHVFEALITEAAVHGYKIDPTDFMIDFELAAKKAIEISVDTDINCKVCGQTRGKKRLQNSLSCLQKESIKFMSKHLRQ